jgi:hypothetical protein
VTIDGNIDKIVATYIKLENNEGGSSYIKVGFCKLKAWFL